MKHTLIDDVKILAARTGLAEVEQVRALREAADEIEATGNTKSTEEALGLAYIWFDGDEEY